MDKQRTVNTVTANDAFSSGLMEAYGRWMQGDTFQNSTIKEEEIPTGQKQGGGSSGSFTSVNGELPAIEYDSSTGLPTIPELGVKDETGKKDPKASSTGGEPPTNPQGLKPKYGQQVRDVTLVGANEETKKAKKDYDGDGKVESGKAEYFGSKDKAIKKAMGKKVKEDAEYGYDKKGNSLNPKDKKKKEMKKEEVTDADKYSNVVCQKCGGKHLTENCPATNEEVEAYLRSEADRVLTHLSEVTRTTYTVTAEAWDIKAEPVDIQNTEEWKDAAKKQTSRIMDMWKEGYGKKKKKKGCS